MSLPLSIPEFGGVAAPISNSGTPLQIDAAWLVDFSRMGAIVDVKFSVVAKADAFSITQPSVVLWASADPASVAAATLLGTLTLSNSAGAFVGAALAASFPNPGGQRYLVVTSTQGSG